MGPRPGQGAAAAILDERGRLLLVKENYDRRRYSLPGGALEAGESALDTVVRETLEETGVGVAIDYLVGLYRLENGFHGHPLSLCDHERPTGEAGDG